MLKSFMALLTSHPSLLLTWHSRGKSHARLEVKGMSHTASHVA